MVMKAMTVGTSRISESSKMKRSFLARMASSTVLYCVLHTESTATGMRLNSSKQPHAPVCARPL
jgi:hypothetical protein